MARLRWYNKTNVSQLPSSNASKLGGGRRGLADYQFLEAVGRTGTAPSLNSIPSS
ncbi:uncharacterized protein PGTG_01684 [Puccinia graminis f. sp. tritici CRL 75-36-700-3]|uniref:Uncharacterized protein n=1 Tax=Puccinia graminis f. sp. tritici (strain CRL 75-36-700-3 / race SCCL) TaxID=418459 RepID=E3JSR6_PUCGT|nr:uncharacterized protein PGTG_01684 [Puccinia graminis f. sp. tritici CRL 75-36-700-3]EFP75091.1 hypothetical protein PGTG_01684 [Puccinia graminis f. sp. tritici CRL 75-36-700-3]